MSIKREPRLGDMPGFGIGCGSLANADGDGAFRGVVELAFERGVRYFDTAALYLGGLSERRLGEALAGRSHDEFIVSTKVGRTQTHSGSSIDPSGLRSSCDYSADATMRSVETSLRQLGLDRLDIVMIHDLTRQLHGPSYDERFDEAMAGAYEALVELRNAGTVGAIGVATMDWTSCMDFALAGDFDAFMPAGQYTLLHRECGSLLDHCAATGAAFLAASPFNSGILATGAVEGAFHNMQPAGSEALARVGAMEAICARHGVPLAAAALQFPTRHAVVSSIVVGSRTAAELQRNLDLLDMPIPDELWTELDAEYAGTAAARTI
ncbi:aldo/keto reductase [Mesorhizobium sp. CAU 1732]|uniref:aldo/keto reductase n=1 Tax=Mesorhizobium sp. CAU 1732 TaxID=3140358 RepID=UPI00326097F5